MITTDDEVLEYKAMAQAAMRFAETMGDISIGDIVLTVFNFQTGWEWHMNRHQIEKVLGTPSDPKNEELPEVARGALRAGFDARAKWKAN